MEHFRHSEPMTSARGLVGLMLKLLSNRTSHHGGSCELIFVKITDLELQLTVKVAHICIIPHLQLFLKPLASVEERDIHPSKDNLTQN